MTTIVDVAKKAGVSFKTVSRVLNGESGVRQETKDKVLKAAEELNYTVNVSARSLRLKRKHLVGLLINNPSLNYSQDIQFGAMVGCQNAGLSLIVENPFEEEAILRLSNQSGILGLILTPPQANDVKLVEKIERTGIPFVRVGTELEIGSSHRIGIDDRQAAFEMTTHLIELGHRDIAFINGPPTHHVCIRRREGYFNALEAAKIPIDRKMVATGEFTYASGMENAELILNSSRKPSAIFACNDEMAAGCLAAAYKLNIRVPEQLSVVGFDDSPVARVVYPALTTVHQSTREMAQRAVEILNELDKGNEAEINDRPLNHQLIFRSTTSKYDQK